MICIKCIHIHILQYTTDIVDIIDLAISKCPFIDRSTFICPAFDTVYPGHMNYVLPVGLDFWCQVYILKVPSIYSEMAMKSRRPTRLFHLLIQIFYPHWTYFQSFKLFPGKKINSNLDW